MQNSYTGWGRARVGTGTMGTLASQYDTWDWALLPPMVQRYRRFSCFPWIEPIMLAEKKMA